MNRVFFVLVSFMVVLSRATRVIVYLILSSLTALECLGAPWCLDYCYTDTWCLPRLARSCTVHDTGKYQHVGQRRSVRQTAAYLQLAGLTRAPLRIATGISPLAAWSGMVGVTEEGKGCIAVTMAVLG